MEEHHPEATTARIETNSHILHNSTFTSTIPAVKRKIRLLYKNKKLLCSHEAVRNQCLLRATLRDVDGVLRHSSANALYLVEYIRTKCMFNNTCASYVVSDSLTTQPHLLNVQLKIRRCTLLNYTMFFVCIRSYRMLSFTGVKSVNSNIITCMCQFVRSVTVRAALIYLICRKTNSIKRKFFIKKLQGI